MHFTTQALGLLSLTPALGAVLHERMEAVPHGWTVASTPEDSKTITLSVGLQQQNEDQFYSKLDSISDPSSAEYGQYLEKEDVDAILKPSAESKSAVLSWLKNAGVTKVSSDDYWVNFATDVNTANKLLNADFQNYQLNGVNKLRTLQYTVPEEVADHVDIVHPTTFFGKTQAFRPVHHWVTDEGIESRAADIDASCQTQITPTCIKELYNVGNYTADEKAGSVVGFGSFLNQSARYTDLAQFETQFAIPSRNFTTILISGGVDNQTVDPVNHGEADLDVENIAGVTSGQLPITQFITGGSPPFIPDIDETDNENEPYVPYYKFLLSKKNSELPQVISNSYGDEEDTVPLSYAKKTCNLIAQIGARGITVLESSGDLGVGAGCKVAGSSNQTRFNPIFPATCPYITAVGGTQAVTPEIAWVASSGGFSDYFAQPKYQKAAVDKYLATPVGAAAKKNFAPYANFSGRAFPDVSAHSLTPNYIVVVNNRLSQSGGTSAASPVWAGIVGLLNDARLRANKTSLGFLNPFLYSTGFAALNDITGGAAVGCNGVNGQTGEPVPGGGIVPGAAWNATTGWDPSTGLGTPDFQKLKAAVLKLK